MINIGGNIGELYVGSTPIEKAYIGNQLVWEKADNTIVDVDGNVYRIKDYINLRKDVMECSIGLYPNFPADGYEIKFYTPKSSGTKDYVTGSQHKSSNRMLGIKILSGILNFSYHSSEVSTINVRNKTIIAKSIPNFENNLMETFIDDVAYETFSLQTLSASSKVFYIGDFTGTTYGAVNGTKLYYIKYYRNGELIRDMIPVQSVETGEYGLFDKVNLKIYFSSGSSSFTGG